GRCAVCTEGRFADALDTRLLAVAVDHIRLRPLTISPRKMWPAGSGRGKIPSELRIEEGRVLSKYADAGWGSLVRDGKFRDERFADDLVEASARLVMRWAPQPTPEWVMGVPS